MHPIQGFTQTANKFNHRLHRAPEGAAMLSRITQLVNGVIAEDARGKELTEQQVLELVGKLCFRSHACDCCCNEHTHIMHLQAHMWGAVVSQQDNAALSSHVFT